ncbi:MAG: hypothetical protein QP744_07790 [Winkia sp. UMB750A]|uniref:hypothetical protein n=1 Tax=unclassified Winkia TaxID=2692119 RepID=UPI000C71708D|nr:MULTISPECIES: hypothetical protein [unclassified Winkia]MDK8225503.1 hypothetical protein [Winkia sp. UMB750B]MDK8257361.1 hypothetical protein [Winkia sp. UMB750A]PLB80673.1 hypothetical protein CYJ21_00270 [Actinomyces sp. UMB0138]
MSESILAADKDTTVMLEQLPAPQLAQLRLPAGARIALLGQTELPESTPKAQVVIVSSDPAAIPKLTEWAQGGGAGFVLLRKPAELRNRWVVAWMQLLEESGVCSYEPVGDGWLFRIGRKTDCNAINEWAKDAFLLASGGKDGAEQEASGSYLALLKYIRRHRNGSVAASPVEDTEQSRHLVAKVKNLQNENDRIKARYKALANSKLGSLTLKWWERGGHK